MSDIEFGLFDWVDRGTGTTAELYESRLALIEAAEAAGFSGYHMAEHHGTPLGMAPSPSVFLAAVAQRTRTLRFGPLAFLLPLYDPLRLVEEVCMLDHLSGGRVELGISKGVSPHELACFGVDAGDTRRMFDESLAVFRAGLTEDLLDFKGQHYSYAAAAALSSPLVPDPQSRERCLRRAPWLPLCEPGPCGPGSPAHRPVPGGVGCPPA